MVARMDINEAYEKRHPWYERPDGTCNLDQPTLINMGEDRPLHLMFPIHWTQAVDILPEAKRLASERDAFLVLLIYGEASDQAVQSLILELADAQVLPLWIGEENRKKLDRIIKMLVHQRQA